jgi:6-pyruvoyl-tetrahydropterin synthase
MAELGYVVSIEAAHGKELHGHNFKIEIVLEAPYDAKTGWVAGIDVHEFMAAVEKVKQELNHQDLRKLFTPASMENIAKHFIKRLKERFPLKFVKVAETENRYAVVYADEVRDF